MEVALYAYRCKLPGFDQDEKGSRAHTHLKSPHDRSQPGESEQGRIPARMKLSENSPGENETSENSHCEICVVRADERGIRKVELDHRDCPVGRAFSDTLAANTIHALPDSLCTQPDRIGELDHVRFEFAWSKRVSTPLHPLLSHI